jgi:hypothetical protein
VDIQFPWTNCPERLEDMIKSVPEYLSKFKGLSVLRIAAPWRRVYGRAEQYDSEVEQRMIESITQILCDFPVKQLSLELARIQDFTAILRHETLATTSESSLKSAMKSLRHLKFLTFSDNGSRTPPLFSVLPQYSFENKSAEKFSDFLWMAINLESLDLPLSDPLDVE